MGPHYNNTDNLQLISWMDRLGTYKDRYTDIEKRELT